MAFRAEQPRLRVATWIVATHERPKLLAIALDSIYAAPMPDGWHSEVIVVRHVHDAGAKEVLERYQREHPFLRAEAIMQHRCGPKRNHALKLAMGELVMSADDDDFQSPLRPMQAVNAYLAGHLVSGVRECRQLHTSIGAVVRYMGHKEDDATGPIAGRARNFATDVLRKVGGWDEFSDAGVDSDLEIRIRKRMKIREHDLGRLQATRYVCV